VHRAAQREHSTAAALQPKHPCLLRHAACSSTCRQGGVSGTHLVAAAALVVELLSPAGGAVAPPGRHGWQAGFRGSKDPRIPIMMPEDSGCAPDCPGVWRGGACRPKHMRVLTLGTRQLGTVEAARRMGGGSCCNSAAHLGTALQAGAERPSLGLTRLHHCRRQRRCPHWTPASHLWVTERAGRASR